MPKGALIAIIIIIVIVALGAVGYFFFREQVLSTYEEVAIAVGIKDKPEEEIVVEEVTPAPTPVPIATLEDVVFTEKSDPSTGTDIASGSTITYTLTLHNKSDGDLSGLAVTDEIPKNTEELTILSTPGGSNDNSNDTMVDISNIELPGGDNQVIRFQVKAGKDLEDGTEISNTATLTKNGSRKISNNNSASVLTVSTQIAMETTSEETTVTEEETTTTTTTEEETTTTTTTEEETTPQPTPTATPAPTPTPTATPVPTATPAPTVTPAPTATPVPTATPTTTPAPEEADDEASPEDMTTVETGGEALNLMIIFASLAAIAGFALVLMRRSLVREK